MATGRVAWKTKRLQEGLMEDYMDIGQAEYKAKRGCRKG
jgi:hypothetical protein